METNAVEWDALVMDIRGVAEEERSTIQNTIAKDWELVAVVSLPLCRRAYFKRRSDPPTMTSPQALQAGLTTENDDPRLQAIAMIVNKKGAFEYRAMQYNIQRVLASDPNEAIVIAEQYCELHHREPTTERPV